MPWSIQLDYISWSEAPNDFISYYATSTLSRGSRLGKMLYFDLFAKKCEFLKQKWTSPTPPGGVLVGNMYYFLLMVQLLARKHDLDHRRPVFCIGKGQRTKRKV
jgi:hypothetical protein